MKLLEFIKDTYKVDSIKNMTRQERGTSFTKFNITGFEQNMPQGDTWQEYLNDNGYKDQLIEMTKQYVLKLASGILPRSIPFIITSRENDYFISQAGNKVMNVCNHEGQTLVLYYMLLKLILILLLFVKIRMSLF